MRILVHDAHELFVDAVSHLLTNRGHVVLPCGDPAEIPAMARDLEVDACLLGIDRAGSVDPGLLETLTALSPPVPTVVLTADEERVASPVAPWPVTWVSKRASAATIFATLEQVSGARPRHDLPPARRSTAADAAPGLGRFLSPREREVLDGLVRGESTEALAQRFGVRPATVRSHVQNLLTKLGVHSRTAAVAYAVEHGLVEVPRRRIGEG